MDYVGQMEKIEVELDHVFRMAGIPKQEIPHLLKTYGDPYDVYYSSETRDLVAKRFARGVACSTILSIPDFPDLPSPN